MSDFLRLLLDSLAYLWPFRIVRTYERGVYYVCGHVVRSTFFLFSEAPGLKLVFPFFAEVEAYPVNTRVMTLPRQSITLRDGKPLVFQAVATLEVFDVVKADTAVTDFVESSQETMMGIVAGRMMEMEMERFDADNRGRLLGGLRQSVNAELAPFGCKCVELRFAQFALGARTIQLWNDQTMSGGLFDG